MELGQNIRQDYDPAVLDSAATAMANAPSDGIRAHILDATSNYVAENLGDYAPEETDLGRFDSLKKRLKPAASLVVAGGIMLVAACGSDSDPTEQAAADTTATTQEAFAAADEACPDTWGVVQTDNTGNRVIAEGVPEIATAQNNEEAREAANIWIDLVERDPEMLAGNANVINSLVGRDTDYQADELYDMETNCFNSTGEQAAAELRAAFNASPIQPEAAPAEGTNTGVDANGHLVRSSNPGITGNRAAIKVSLPNGEEFYIMERCGNIVTKTPPPNLPPGPTDEPEPEPTTTTTGIDGKYDDGRVPGPINEPGEVDGPGVGPAGQTPNENGYIPAETPPPVPATTSTTHRQTSPTTGRPTATTSPQPTSTNPPQTATTSVATTAPQTGTLPPRP